MRTSPSVSTIVPITTAAHSFGRRPLSSFFQGVTCMALVKLDENQAGTAIKVSDDGHPAHFAWLPKAMVTIAKEDYGPFIVVTINQQIAAQKRLQIRFIDPARFTEPQRDQLRAAIETAARARLCLRNHREPLAYPGRNAFA